MNESTSLLGLEDEFAVLQINRIDPGTVRVVIEVSEREGVFPGCGGVPTSRIKERPLVRLKDLPASGQQAELWWPKRCLRCLEAVCATASFTRQSDVVPARARLTTRLRTKIGSAIASGNPAFSEVVGEYGVGWATAQRALVGMANRLLPEPGTDPVLGIDETRVRTVRWVKQAGWKRSDPWITSFVNADTRMPGRLLGLTPGRSGASVIS